MKTILYTIVFINEYDEPEVVYVEDRKTAIFMINNITWIESGARVSSFEISHDLPISINTCIYNYEILEEEIRSNHGIESPEYKALETLKFTADIAEED